MLPPTRLRAMLEHMSTRMHIFDGQTAGGRSAGVVDDFSNKTVSVQSMFEWVSLPKVFALRCVLKQKFSN